MSEENIVKKIKKLLALAADNPDSPEAKLAAERAEELMTKYQIDSIEEEISSEFEGLTEEEINLVNTGGKNQRENYRSHLNYQSDNWEVRLGQIIAYLTDTRLILKSNKICFIGFKKDIQLSSWYYKLLRLKIYKNVQEKYGYAKLHNKSKKIYSYTMGYVASINQLVEQIINSRVQKQDNQCKDLVVQKKDIIQDYLKQQKETKPLSMSKGKENKFDYNAFDQGIKDGAKEKLNEPIE